MLTSTYARASFGLAVLLLGLGFLASGCDFLDPTNVENPQTTEDDLQDAPELVRVFLPGLEAQFARALGSTVVATEIASDNYSIHGTGLDGTAMDYPERISPTTFVINNRAADTGSYWNLQELRALADFVLTDILPEDEDALDADVALVHYYRGMAFLMQAENYGAVSITENTAPLAPSALYAEAAAAFQEARSLSTSGTITLRTSAALARLHRGLGNPDEAAQYAQEALAASGTFVIDQGYDAQNLVNAPHLYLVTRISREMQPLPRLDFLDPKYTSEDDAIAVAKAEEMHLILAEAALLEGTPEVARDHLYAVLDLIASPSREAVAFNDEDQRTDNNLNPRPQSSDIQIAFEPGAPFQQNLVLDRPGVIETPPVSATSITEADIDAASGNELVRLLYQMRQEVLFLEGRRLHDLGLRLPMMLPELEQNTSIAAGDLGTETIIPSYIPPENEMDLYTPVEIYEENEDGAFVTLEDEITMLHDMNRVLAEERGLVMQNPRLP